MDRKLDALIGLALTLALTCACTSDPRPRPAISDRQPHTATDSAGREAAEAHRLPRAGGDSSAAASAASGALSPDTLPADTIAPLGPPGAPASAFPKPSRPVAEIVTDTWSDEETRDKAGEAERVMSLLGVREGMHVADVGAGSGYYTVRLSRRVGPSGRVFAEDIVPEYLEKLRDRVRSEGLLNVRLAQGDPHDPRLPPRSVDVALLVHMYHEVEQPYGFLYNLYPALRPGARVAVVDLDRKTSEHGTPPRLLRCEFEALGYRQLAIHRLGRKSGYLAIFAPPATSTELTIPESFEVCAAA